MEECSVCVVFYGLFNAVFVLFMSRELVFEAENYCPYYQVSTFYVGRDTRSIGCLLVSVARRRVYLVAPSTVLHKCASRLWWCPMHVDSMVWHLSQISTESVARSRRVVCVCSVYSPMVFPIVLWHIPYFILRRFPF